MRKLWKIMLGAVVVVSLAACTPTTNKPAKNGTGTQPETQAKEVVEKLPDADAPELELISVYYPNAEGTGLRQAVDGVETLDAESLVALLIEYGTLGEGTEVLDFQTSGESDTQISGPGESTVVLMYSNATLDLNQVPEDIDKVLTETAIGNTFTESMNIQELAIKVNGEDYASGLTYNEHYDKLK